MQTLISINISKYILVTGFLCIFSCKNATKAEVAEIKRDPIVLVNDSDVIYPQVSTPYLKDMYADTKITFQIEDLKRVDTTLDEEGLHTIFENIIKDDFDKARGYSEDKDIDIEYNIKSYYNGPEKLVNFGNYSFFRGMYKAYADHRPFVLSPDIIWLLISQGFANHVNNNAEELRNLFVNFEDKATLVVHYDSNDKNLTWEDMFSTFSTQIAHFTGNYLIDNLKNDFTTTTAISKTVSEITIMSATEPYFEYWASVTVCGIPEITLEGTPEDWGKVLTKAQYLKKYKLSWWINELEPVLKEFINASKGNINKEFWKNIFKHHESEMCGDPSTVDGWIVKFFPYLMEGKRTDLKTISLDDKLAPELVKVDLKYKFSNGKEDKIIPLEIWAGFIGLRQDKKTFALKPEMGWMIRKKDSKNITLKHYFENDDPVKTFMFTTSEIPKELLQIKEVDWLVISFTKDINIPDEMANMKIKTLSLSGEISNKEIKRVCRMFPDTELEINNKKYNKISE
ncbi:uncharacterized protein DUF4419 [Dysgonomonas alginatilytica]|uniref:Uncharacterized protein DUF4419 n=1 Tax=Dysgonomonas alginatilytica TaxID=1605892 RepID=A0A2V3PSG4_9BACT|nr:DUF4419 domain-containing protein [Dysgonomonas alginatilytica]PXV65554.1 uncharacterized protein DUF4419 [Dysgonomonas alginatilytica]